MLLPVVLRVLLLLCLADRRGLLLALLPVVLRLRLLLLRLVRLLLQGLLRI